MSFNSKKHIILIFSILLMLVIVPTSFASDMNDDGYVNTSVDDMIIYASVGDVNASVSASADTDDVLSSGENVIITANKNTIDDYTPGNSESIKISVSKDDDFDYYYSMGTVYVYAKLNDGTNYDKNTWFSVNSGSSTNFDLNKIDSSYFNSGENTLTFYPYNLNSALTYSPATVTINVAGGISEPVDESQIYVDGSVTATGTGSESSPFKTIGEAITKANTLDESTIHIADGTYIEYGFSLTKSMTIVGSGMDNVIIDAQGKGRIFDITTNNVEVIIKNLTLANGTLTATSNNQGGAIRIYLASVAGSIIKLTVDSVKFVNNVARGAGGAIYNDGGHSITRNNVLNVKNCEFINCSSSNNNGGAIQTQSTSTITNSLFRGNRAGGSSVQGGAIYIASTKATNDITISECTFENNTANKGVIYTSAATIKSLNINNNAFYETCFIIFASSDKVGKNITSIENNWWGSNSPNFTNILSTVGSPSKYAQVKLTVDSSEITTKENSTISTSFVWNDETTENIENLPVRTVKLISDGDLTDAEGNVGLTSTFSASEVGTYYVNASVDNELLSENIDVTQAEDKLTGDWYVDSAVSSSGDGKTRETAFKTIEEAATAATNDGGANQIIVIIEGSYVVNTGMGISKNTIKNLTFIGDGDVNITRTKGYVFSFGSSTNYTIKGLTFLDCIMTGAVSPAYTTVVQASAASATVNVIDCDFINCYAGAIVKGQGNTIITRCNFINNTAIGTYQLSKGIIDFYASTNSYTSIVNYCNFIGNDYSASGVLVFSNGIGNINLNYNYWGSNDGAPNDVATSGKYILNNHAIINSIANPNPVEYGSDTNIVVTFKLNNNDELRESMPELTLDVIPVKSLGNANSTVTILDNEATLVYSATAEGNEIVNFNVNDNTLTSVEFTIEEVDDGSKYYVDKSYTGVSDGSKDKPFKTIQDALNEGQNKPIIVNEGVYSVDTTYTFTNHVNITGRGKVILTRTGQGTLFEKISWAGYAGYEARNITLKNVIIENITSTNGIIYYQGASSDYITLTMDNCTVRNNSGTYLIRAENYYNLNISNNNFINNSVRYLIMGGATGSYVNVNYNNFIGNNVSSYYVNIQSYSIGADLNYNFWGTNEGVPEDYEGYKMVSSSFAPTKWVIVDASFDGDVYAIMNNTLNVDFIANDGSDLSKFMPSATFDLTALNGTVSETVTLTKNVGTAIYSTSKEGNDNITVSAFDNEIKTIEFTVEEDISKKLFVNQSYTGGSNDGSKDKPYTTVKAALDAAKNGDANQIIIFDGTYTDLSSAYTLSKSISLIGRGDNVILKNVYEIKTSGNDLYISNLIFTGSSSTYDALFYPASNSGKITIYNTTFRELTIRQLIDTTGNVVVNLTKVNVVDSKFTGTGANYNKMIGIRNSNNPLLIVNYCNFINVNYVESLIYTQSTNVDANYNFWGFNVKPTSLTSANKNSTTIVGANVLDNINYYVVLVPEINSDNIIKEKDYDISFVFKSTTDGITFTDLKDTMPTVSFNILSTLGNTFSDSTITMINNNADVTYLATNNGDEIINITYTNFITDLTFTVETSSIIETGLTVSPDELDLNVGDNVTIAATSVPSDLVPAFSSSNESVVTVDADGNVVAVGAGSAVITVSVGDGLTYAVNTTTVNVTVTKKEDEYSGIIYVDKEGNNENDGSEFKPVATIERAIELATSENNTAHKIIIHKGTYEEYALVISSDLEIIGEDAVIDALFDGRILEITGGDVKISGITFANANVTGYGGAISIKGAVVEIDDCIFVNNTATSGAGAILWNSDDGKLSNSTFKNNSGRNGAAVAIGELGWSPKGDNTVITNCVFDNNDNIYNAAGCIGLAIYADGVKVINSNFTNNHGQINTNHGTLYITGDNAEVYGCLFENNTMDGAGALQADGDNVNIHNNIFRNNTITGGVASRAGAIELQSINAEITNNLFVNNGGDDCREGGAINIVYVDYDGEILISENTFINNSAAYGGAIYVDGGFDDYYNEFTINIDKNVFDANYAGQGAGIYTLNTGDTVVIISNNEFKNQSAAYGGAIYSYDSVIELSSNIMNNCTALENGNDIYLEYGEISSEVTLKIYYDATISLGDNVTVNALLSDDNGNTISGGLITLTANGNSIEELNVKNAMVSIVFAPSVTGNYTISGTYDLADDVNVESIIIQVIDVVSKVDANISAKANGTHIVVTLPSDATGNLTVTINNISYDGLINSGIAIVEIPDLIPANYTADVIYSGDDKYNNDTTSVEFIIPEKENATITIKSDETPEGENATVIITLPSDAAGNVIVGNSSADVINGTATVIISDLPIGNTTLPVIYSGDDKYNPISTSVVVIVVPKEPVSKENVTISVNPITIIEGENATVIITLPSDAAGNVIVGNSSADVINGTAVVSMSDLFIGKYTFNILYSGDSKYNPATSSVVVIVNPKPTFIVEALDVEKYYGGSERFRVKVTDLDGNPISGQLVEINIGERQYNKTTNANGTVTAPLGLNSGLYNISVKVNNTITNATTLIKSTVEGSDVLMIYRNGSQYLAIFKDANGNYLAEGTEIEFNINGVLYKRNVRANGIARLNLNLEQGNYVITALNTNTNEKCANNITILSNIIENRDITKYYRNGTQYTVKVLGKDGNPIGKGANVTFNINGVFYTRTTNNQSIAKMNINLQPGNYVITADYQGCKVSNEITVLPVLSAKDLNKVYGSPDQFIVALVDGQGNALASEKVSFNINGVMYERTTNTNGQAKLNIKLQAGEYIITSTYKGASIANKVTVTA